MSSILLIFLFLKTNGQDKQIIKPMTVINGGSTQFVTRILPSAVYEDFVACDALVENTYVAGIISRKNPSSNIDIFSKTLRHPTSKTNIQKIIKVYNGPLVILASYYVSSTQNSVNNLITYKYKPVLIWMDPNTGIITNQLEIDGFSNYEGFIPTDMVTDDGIKFDIIASSINVISTGVPKLHYLHLDLSDPSKNSNIEVTYPSNTKQIYATKIFKGNYNRDLGSLPPNTSFCNGVYIVGFVGDEADSYFLGSTPRPNTAHQFGFLLDIQRPGIPSCGTPVSKSLTIKDINSPIRSIAAGWIDGGLVITGQKWNRNIFSVSPDLQSTSFPNHQIREFLPQNDITFPLKYRSILGEGQYWGYVGMTGIFGGGSSLRSYTFQPDGQLENITGSNPVSSIPYTTENGYMSSDFCIVAEHGAIVSQRFTTIADNGTPNLSTFSYLTTPASTSTFCDNIPLPVQVQPNIQLQLNEFNFSNGSIPAISPTLIWSDDATTQNQSVSCNFMRMKNPNNKKEILEYFGEEKNNIQISNRVQPIQLCDFSQYDNSIQSVLIRKCENIILYEKNISTNSNKDLKKEKLDISIYPNPTNDFFEINCQDAKLIQVLDRYGKLVYTQKIVNNSKQQNIQVNCKTWAKGLYIVNVVNTSNETVGKKIIIL